MKNIMFLGAFIAAVVAACGHGGGTVPCVENMPGMTMCSQTPVTPSEVPGR